MEHPDSQSIQQLPDAGELTVSTSAASYTTPFEKNIARGFHSPSLEDVQVITASLEQPDRELVDLETEIAQTTAKLNALKKRRAHLLRHTTQGHAYIAPSPIRQLPTEILQLIFIEACTSYQRYEYDLPLDISWTCWKWRQVALATPAIWTNIYFGGHKWYHLFDVYARRSRGLPLSVKIKVPYQRRPSESDAGEWDEYEETYDYHVEIMVEVFSTYRRWRDVELHLGMEDLQLLDVCAFDSDLEKEGPLEELESVTLGIEGHDYLETEEIPCAFRRKHAPNLYSFDVVERPFN
ncbi:hypothetical protein BDZ89DRAFT_1111574 [Hymenopellis radicata]|nr:hypothetical protein BDZ89DRAFT_1111574 [Hymenopellis radicata]